jgi:protoporphyrinogen oxidase
MAQKRGAEPVLTSGSKNTWESIVLGAGTSGMVAASILSGRFEGRPPGTARTVLVLDEFPDLGGNHLSFGLNGYTFDIGSFFFSENSPFLAHFPELLPLYENHDPGTYSVARITPQMKLARYPADYRNDIFGHGLVMPFRFLASALYGRLFVDEDQSADGFARHWIGDRFFRESGLRSYMERLFGEKPENIESQFAYKRMRWVKRNARAGEFLRTCIRQYRTPDPAPVQRQLVRPRDGFPGLYRVAEAALAEHGASFRLNSRLTGIRNSGAAGMEVHLADGSILKCRQLVSTIPLNRTLPLCGLDLPPQLRTACLLTLFVSFSGHRGFAANVLYNFSAEGQWKRLTMHSDFYGDHDGRAYFSVECIMQGDADCPDQRFGEFKSLVQKMGLFDGDLKLEGHRITKSAYPVYRQGATAAAERAIAQLRTMGVLSFGRQGGFDYQPTSGISTAEAERQLEARKAGAA